MRLILSILLLVSVAAAQGGGTPLFPVIKDKKWGYINPKGELAIPYKFQYAMPFWDGLAAAKNDAGKFGFIDKDGKWVIKPQYRTVNRFTDGACLVQPMARDAKSVFIDKKGKPFMEGARDMSMEFSDGLVLHAPRHEKKYNIRNVTYYNRKGEAVIKIPQISGGDSFSGGLAAVTRLVKGKASVTYIDVRGEVVIGESLGLLAGGSFSEGLAYARSARHEGCIGPRGKWLFFVKGVVQPFKSGLARVGYDRVGFIDKHGKFAIKPTFAAAGDFAEGFAPVKLAATGPWGYCDRTGRVVIEPKYLGASQFEFGLARVTFVGGWGYIDGTGRMVWQYKP